MRDWDRSHTWVVHRGHSHRHERLVAALSVPDDAPLLMVTAAGQGIRFIPSDVRPMGRTAGGVRGIKLAPADKVVGATVASDGNTVLIGHGNAALKRVMCADFPMQGRAGKGVRASVVAGRYGNVNVLALVSDQLLLYVDGEWLLFEVRMAPLVGRDAPPSKSKLLGSAITGVI